MDVKEEREGGVGDGHGGGKEGKDLKKKLFKIEKVGIKVGGRERKTDGV